MRQSARLGHERTRMKRNILLWSLYDFANSIVMIVFLLYFAQWPLVILSFYTRHSCHLLRYTVETTFVRHAPSWYYK